MTCQYCQTWILDEEHRCHRCGRRVRSTPQRVSANSFPVAAAATAYDYSTEYEERPEIPIVGQGVLFERSPSGDRVIAFESLTSRADRQLIQARAAGLDRPTPLKTEKIALKHARRAKPRVNSQQGFDFHGQDEVLSPPQSSIISDAVVAPAALRLQAALVDLFLMVIPIVIGIAIFFYAGGEFSTDKHNLPYFLVALGAIPAFYKLLWTIAGKDTIGMQSAGLVLVDFDGNPPSSTRRYLRCFGAALSLLAAGIGMVWSLVDEDRLTWHDHISSTYPAIAEDED